MSRHRHGVFILCFGAHIARLIFLSDDADRRTYFACTYSHCRSGIKLDVFRIQVDTGRTFPVWGVHAEDGPCRHRWIHIVFGNEDPKAMYYYLVSNNT